MPVTCVNNLGWAVPAAREPPWTQEAPRPTAATADGAAGGHTSQSDHPPYTPSEPRPAPPRLDTHLAPQPAHSTPSPPSDFSAMGSDDLTSSDTDEDLIREGPSPLDDDDDDDDDDDLVMACGVKAEPGSGTPTPVTPSAGPDSLSATPLTAAATATPTRPRAAVVAGPKRPRGRPRSSTLPKARPAPKTTQTRTKTGCLTCRKRKKKCDERKPECDNCNKNNIVCEGYPAKQVYVSGRQTKPDMRLLKIDRMPEQPRYVFPGLETELDNFLFEHFHSAMSTILTLDDNTSNPFVELVIPMSLDHKGLMHSLLALSGSHMSRFAPGNADYEQRRMLHFGHAMSALQTEVAAAQAADARGDASPAEPLVASIIIQCLIPITEGSVDGNHRGHLAAARAIIKPRPGSAFGEFAWEFFKYHDMSNTMTSLERPPLSPEELADDDDPLTYPWAAHHTDPATGLPTPVDETNPGTPYGLAGPPTPPLHMPAAPAPPGEGVMIGVCDGLFRYITRITAIRDRIRERKRRGHTPVVEYRSIRQASALGARLRDWRSGHAPRTPKWVAAELYRETAFVYLHRSLRASRPDPDLALRVARGLAYLRALPPDHAAQSLALLPTFVLGCAAFDAEQRREIAAAFRQLWAYSRLGNIDRAQEVVARVWAMMDRGDERSWDWETVMADMNYNFLVT